MARTYERYRPMVEEGQARLMTKKLPVPGPVSGR